MAIPAGDGVLLRLTNDEVAGGLSLEFDLLLDAEFVLFVRVPETAGESLDLNCVKKTKGYF